MWKCNHIIMCSLKRKLSSAVVRATHEGCPVDTSVCAPSASRPDHSLGVFSSVFDKGRTFLHTFKNDTWYIF